jgi:hypothetical protein
MLNATRSRYWYAKAALQGHDIAYGALSMDIMWEGQSYEDDEELMAEVEALFNPQEEEEEEDDGGLNWIPIATDANGEKHVDYFSLRMAGREDEYEELEAKLQEYLKNQEK